jgi:PAS domain S-box-containing protein
MRTTAKSAPVAYLLALTALTVAIVVRWLLDPVLQNFLPLVTLYGAVAIGVWAGGYRPALLVVIGGYLACDYLFIEPRGAIGTPGMQNLVGAVAYLLTCSIIIAFGVMLATNRRRDENDRDERAEQLAAAEARIRSVLDNVIDGIITIDERGILQTFSRAAERQFGYSAAEVIGQNVRILMPEPYHSAHDDYLANYLRTGDAKIIGKGREVVGRRKDGSTFPMDLAVGEFRVGERRHFSGIVRDITERKRSEDALRESEKQLRLALEAGPLGTWTWDLRSNEVAWSSGLEVIHGLPPGTFQGTFEAFEHDIHPEDRESVGLSVQRALAGGEHHVEYRIIRPDGTMRWVEGQGQVLRDDADVPLRMVGICRDVTDRKEAEEALRASEHALKAAHRRKDEFLATLAHELRNPLAPISIGAQLLQSPHSDPELIAQAGNVIDRQVRIMVRLVDDLLDVSRISEGKLDLRREHVDLGVILRSAIEISRPLIEERDHELTASFPSEPVELEADPVRLAQVFANLLNNAAKYTEHGGSIRVTTAQDGDDIHVSVSDTGIGIPADVLPHVFEMFMQGGSMHARSRGGLGIGLTLVKRLVEMHDGSIEARSGGTGKGSEFVVRLPVLTRVGV